MTSRRQYRHQHVYGQRPSHRPSTRLTLHKQEHGESVRGSGWVVQLRDDKLIDGCWRARTQNSHERSH
jgi:hypothetical protein